MYEDISGDKRRALWQEPVRWTKPVASNMFQKMSKVIMIDACFDSADLGRMWRMIFAVMGDAYY